MCEVQRELVGHGQQAQEHGVRVHLLGITEEGGNQSWFLRREADTTHMWGTDELGGFLSRSPEPPAPAPQPNSGMGSEDVFHQVAQEVANEVPREHVVALLEEITATKRRPQKIDGDLLTLARSRLDGRLLTGAEKNDVRAFF